MNLVNRTLLSNREVEVLAEITTGKSNKEIANGLFVTEKTVKFHLTNIYKKIHVKSRAEAIVKVLHKGLEKENQMFVDRILKPAPAEAPAPVEPVVEVKAQPSSLPMGSF